MSSTRCPLHCQASCGLNRRDFLRGSICLAGSSLLGGCASIWKGSGLAGLWPKVKLSPMQPNGPASRYTPTIEAAFVRRKEEYGMLWPGAVYDGQAAKRLYTAQMRQTAQKLAVKLNIREKPIYSLAEADSWLSQVASSKVDGLLLVTLDRQQHSWPTAYKAAESGIPTVIFSPIGTSFTVNTEHLANKPGCVVYSGEDFSQAAFGMKMLAAGAKMRRARCIVLMGDKRFEGKITDLGITLKHVPVETYLQEYRRTSESKEILAMVKEYIRQARRIDGPTRQDIINGVKSYFVAGKILQQEQGDAITMDCLGALAKSKISLPCLAWSRLNDEGIPAACEADYGAVASQIIVQFLFDRPGFQQDPVADTLYDAIIGAHCSCPTRLEGFHQRPEPFDLVHHHALRDATAKPFWRKGKRVTCIDVLPGGDGSFYGGINCKKQSEMLISTGTVMSNIKVPPNGGCVVSVRFKMDTDQNVLSFPGFHQVFFYGDYKQQMVEFCQLFNIKARVV